MDLDISKFWIHEYCDPSGLNLHPISVKFTGLPIPYWIFYSHVVFYEIGQKLLTRNQKILTLFVLLCNFDEKYWRHNPSMCPRWTVGEQELLARYCAVLNRHNSHNDYSLQIDKYELFRLVYNRTNVNDPSVVALLAELHEYCSKTFALELEMIEYMTKTPERSERLKKLLHFSSILSSVAGIPLQSLIKIVRDAEEELGLRQTAMELTYRYKERSIDDILCFVSMCNTPSAPRQIQRKAMERSTYSLEFSLLDMRQDDRDILSNILFENAVNFTVEDRDDASLLVKYTLCHTEIIDENHSTEYNKIISKLENQMDYLTEDMTKDLCKLLEIITPDVGLLFHTIPSFLEILMRDDTVTSSEELSVGLAKYFGYVIAAEGKGIAPEDVFRRAKNRFCAFFVWYLRDTVTFYDKGCLEIIQYRLYHELERINTSFSNSEYLLDHLIDNFNENSTPYFIPLLCEHILQGFPIPRIAEIFQEVKRQFPIMSSEDKSIMLGLLGLIDFKATLRLQRKGAFNIIVSNYSLVWYCPIIQYAILSFLENVMEKTLPYSVEFEDIVSNPMVQSIYKRVDARLAVEYAPSRRH